MFWTKRHTDTLTGKMIEVNFACGIDARDEQLLRVPFTHFTSTPNQICAKITLKPCLQAALKTKLTRPQWLTKIGLLAVAPVVLVYLGYWLYLGRNSLAGSSAQSKAFRLVGEALLEQKVGQQKKYSVALAFTEGPDMCSFWTFEAVRTKCQGVSLVVRDFEETDREKTVDIARHIAQGLASPCQHVDAVKVKPRPSAGIQPPADHSKIKADLGCNLRPFTYRVRVQVRASSFIQNVDGSGHYVNRHIYTRSLQGKIT